MGCFQTDFESEWDFITYDYWDRERRKKEDGTTEDPGSFLVNLALSMPENPTPEDAERVGHYIRAFNERQSANVARRYPTNHTLSSFVPVPPSDNDYLFEPIKYGIKYRATYGGNALANPLPLQPLTELVCPSLIAKYIPTAAPDVGDADDGLSFSDGYLRMLEHEAKVNFAVAKSQCHYRAHLEDMYPYSLMGDQCDPMDSLPTVQNKFRQYLADKEETDPGDFSFFHPNGDDEISEDIARIKNGTKDSWWMTQFNQGEVAVHGHDKHSGKSSHPSNIHIDLGANHELGYKIGVKKEGSKTIKDLWPLFEK